MPYLHIVSERKIILGIDPGTILMGYAIIEITGNKVRLVMMDVLKLAAQKDSYTKLQHIHNKVSVLVAQYRPDYFAIEAPFFGKNVQSMLKLGRAQGVAIAAAIQAAVEVTEYSPKRIKQVITGNGNANKDQVWKMLQTILKIDEKPQYYDATDALAVALCHHYENGKHAILNNTKRNDWKEFILKNPDKVRT